MSKKIIGGVTMFLETNNEYSQSIEIKNFRYYVAGRVVSEFEILCFSDGKFAGQGSINFNKEMFATNSVYSTLDETLAASYEKIEKKIKNDPWVIKTKEHLRKEGIKS
jgi:hypothetical protein